MSNWRDDQPVAVQKEQFSDYSAWYFARTGVLQVPPTIELLEKAISDGASTANEQFFWVLEGTEIVAYNPYRKKIFKGRKKAAMLPLNIQAYK